MSDSGRGFYASLSDRMGRPYEREGDRISELVSRVTVLKREEQYDEALQLLHEEIDRQENDSATGLGGVAPWYYEQAAVIYRKVGRHDDEIAVLERFAVQQHAPGAKPPQLLERLIKAKDAALRRAGLPVHVRSKPAKPETTSRTGDAEPALPSAVEPRFSISTDQEPVSDFIALDVETANADFASICSIGLVHFRRGEVFKSLTILVDPEDHFDPINVGIHGIRPEDVLGKPTMAKVFPVIADVLRDVVVIHHSPFDKTAMTRAAAKYGTTALPCVWLDTIRVARRAWPHFADDGEGYGLARLAAEFGIAFDHHDAAEDARAAGLVMQQALASAGLNLVQWLERVEKPVRLDASVSREGNAAGPLANETVVFTGKISMLRAKAADLAAAAGADVDEDVTKRTTILVVGDQDLRYTTGEEKSAKHRKAEQLIADGRVLRIVGEGDFLRLIEQDMHR